MYLGRLSYELEWYSKHVVFERYQFFDHPISRTQMTRFWSFEHWAREHYEQHHGNNAPQTPSTAHTTPTKINPQTQIPISPSAPDLQSPIILGHHHHNNNNSINNNINWSPTILGHHRHSHIHSLDNTDEDTLLPPIHIMDMFEYLDHLDSAHKNFKNF